MVNQQLAFARPMSASLEVAYAAVRESLGEYRRSYSLRSVYVLGCGYGMPHEIRRWLYHDDPVLVSP